ncbi:MAG: HNH endonuclease, partial [Acidimicrobiia bacterium]|nr:HNH endonuclease [Acidimicrobiia bacterium]
DQIRADIMLDILEGAHTPIGAARTGSVHLAVDLATLAELNDNSGDIAGFGPVTADLARQLADDLKDSEWSFSIVDPASGDVVCDGTTQRRPLRSQRRRLRARDKHCIWPGCRMPSVDCDMDHRVRHADGGCGHDHNLAPLCRFHHRMRHQTDWTYRRLDNGDIEWTSGTGRIYLTRRRARAP